MKKHAGIAISRHLDGLKCQKIPGLCPSTPLGAGGLQCPPNPPAVLLPRFARSLSATPPLLLSGMKFDGKLFKTPERALVKNCNGKLFSQSK